MIRGLICPTVIKASRNGSREHNEWGAIGLCFTRSYRQCDHSGPVLITDKFLTPPRSCPRPEGWIFWSGVKKLVSFLSLTCVPLVSTFVALFTRCLQPLHVYRTLVPILTISVPGFDAHLNY